MNNDCSYKSSFELLWVLNSIVCGTKLVFVGYECSIEVLIFRVTSVRYCLISQNGQVVENWRSASGTEIRTTDLAAMEITVYHQDDNHEVQRPTDWPVQVRNKIDLLKK
ncbi:hypothetical protein AVEN_10480-1 [Araneus ventricosus]|uniref:Uncharacterized protein n=1 Tax=Araneus ventricosus TaxID=182803 RepID=A0A4Y2UFP0_ARAVE|nr:hypothetical protein AVEN_10480-1 [Araneus ventricosus]